MQMRYMVCGVLFAVACGKKADENKAPPETPKVVDKQPPAPTAPPVRVMPTSKSPEALAAFQKGHDLMVNARDSEAIEHLKKAIELDPEFAFAMAELGLILPGAEGTDLLAKAGPLSAKLPEAERAWIEAHQATRAGDPAKAKQKLLRVLELAPGTWEVDLTLANMANGTNDADTAIKHAEHAIAVNPKLANAHNVLAYAYANKREWDKAIAEAQKQVELLPNEPNPIDTLAEVQLWAGKFDDAATNFVKATTLEPKFVLAWNGAALARAYKGDFPGAYEALEKQKAGAQIPPQRNGAVMDMAMLKAAEDKVPEALTTLDALDKQPDFKKLPVFAFAPLARANILAMAGKHADAAKHYATAKQRAETLAGDARASVMHGYRVGMLRMAAMTGKPLADADKMLQDAEAHANQLGDAIAKLDLGYLRGLATWAKSGPKAALDELSKCDYKMLLCRYDLAIAMRKSGDAASADAIDKQITETPMRDVTGVYFRRHPSSTVK